jgi:hypothetical protein
MSIKTTHHQNKQDRREIFKRISSSFVHEKAQDGASQRSKASSVKKGANRHMDI